MVRLVIGLLGTVIALAFVGLRVRTLYSLV